MNINEAKKNFIENKVSDYFSKNPSSKSVRVKGELGENKFFWNVRKEANGYDITEVSAVTESYFIESKEDEIGKTRSGKPIYSPDHPKYKAVSSAIKGQKGDKSGAVRTAMRKHFPEYDVHDHLDANTAHDGFNAKSTKQMDAAIYHRVAYNDPQPRSVK